MIRVAVVEDHHLVRDGIRAVIERADDIEVVGEAEDGLAALELVERFTPDVVVMDVTMPRLNGIEATTRLRARPEPPKVVILSMHADPAMVRRAMFAGASGYVLKGSVTEELLLAIRAAHRGATYLSPAASETLIDTAEEHTGPSDDGVELTNREREVLTLIGDGLTNKSIARKLDISVKTVERHRTSMMAKLDAHSIVELVRAAIRHGFIELED